MTTFLILACLCGLIPFFAIGHAIYGGVDV